MMDVELKLVLEALLMSHHQGLTLDKIQETFDEGKKPSKAMLLEALSELQDDYQDRAVELKCFANRYQIQIKALYSQWITRLLIEKPPKYSRALLETLAIIAYKQPVTRADIEDIRGVTVSTSVLKTLLERDWIQIVGYKDVPGKPAMYKTTNSFLQHFNLKNLAELPLVNETYHE